MKKYFLLLGLFSFCYAVELSAQTNLDFETGDLTGWTCETGCAPNAASHPYYAGDGYSPAGNNCSGSWTISAPLADRHQVINASGTAFCATVLSLNTADVGSKILKLGNEQVYGQAERVSQTFGVTQNNAILIIKYAVVMQDGPGNPHVSANAPFFKVEFLDVLQKNIYCLDSILSKYLVAPQNFAQTPGYNGSAPCWVYLYQNWRTDTFDLTGYIGQTVTLRMTTSDCAVGGDACIAYVNVSSTAVNMSPVSIVSCDSVITTVNAPAGNNYSWTPNNDTTQLVNLSTGSYSVSYTDLNGCSKIKAYSVNSNAAPTSISIYLSGSVLTTDDTGMVYQWYKDSVLITGADSSSHLPLANGNYYLIITHANGCTVQSQSYNHLTTSANILSKKKINIIYNHSSKEIVVKDADSESELKIYDITGRSMCDTRISGQDFTQSVSAFPPGIYLLNIKTVGSNQTTRISIY